MTDSRAALEEAAEKFWREKHARAKGNIVPITSALADFYEQESSSLKLLLRAMCKGLAQLEHFITDEGTVWVLLVSETPRSLSVELDSSGIPVLTQEIIEALKNAAIF